MSGLSRGRSENTSNAFMTLNERLARRAPHGKRSMFETAHGKEPFPRRRGTAGGNIDSVGENSPVRMWRAGRSPMLTGRTIDSNPSLSARSKLVRRSSREKDERSEAGQLPPKGSVLGVWTLLRVFSPVSESQPHETTYLPSCADEEKCDECEIRGKPQPVVAHGVPLIWRPASRSERGLSWVRRCGFVPTTSLIPTEDDFRFPALMTTRREQS